MMASYQQQLTAAKEQTTKRRERVAEEEEAQEAEGNFSEYRTLSLASSPVSFFRNFCT